MTDWTECIICQKATTEVLRWPAESKRGTQGAGYQNHADLLQGFHKAGELPISLDLSRLDDGGGIDATSPPKFRLPTMPKFRLSQAALSKFGLISSTPPKLRQLC